MRAMALGIVDDVASRPIGYCPKHRQRASQHYDRRYPAQYASLAVQHDRDGDYSYAVE